MENYKVVIKVIKPKVKETDPIKIAEMKEKRKLQREAHKNKPKDPNLVTKAIKPKESKIKTDDQIEEINKKVKNLIGFSVDEINDKLKGIPPPQPIKNELKKKMK
jgi:hypothetical protein